MTDIKPKYEVHKANGTFKRVYYKVIYKTDDKGKTLLDKDGNKIYLNLEQFEKEEDRGFMVYFPDGHSIHVRNENKLKELGFNKPANFVDMETGEEVDQPLAISLKELSARKTQPSRTGK